MPEDTPIIITNRDVYNLLKEHIAKVETWQDVHAASDTKAFSALNIKFYGILAGILAVAAVLVPNAHL